MDAVGVQLETSTVVETRQTIGNNWPPGKAGRALEHEDITEKPKSDNLSTKVSVIKHAPTASKLDKEWQQSVPKRWPEVGEYLQQHTGYNFPFLSLLKSSRAVRAIAATLCENLNPSQSTIGIDIWNGKTKISGIDYAGFAPPHKLTSASDHS